jgi:hypothetical protein
MGDRIVPDTMRDMGKWASHIESKPLPTAEEQAEFLKIKRETPAYVQKYSRKSKNNKHILRSFR